MSEREKFQKWWERITPNHHLYDQLSAWIAWQAATSTRKPFCLGVIKANGDPYKTFHPSEEEQANKFVKFLNEEDIVGSPYRVVPLFYEEQS